MYYHTLVTSENQPSLSLMRQLYQIVDARYVFMRDGICLYVHS